MYVARDVAFFFDGGCFLLFSHGVADSFRLGRTSTPRTSSQKESHCH